MTRDRAFSMLLMIGQLFVVAAILLFAVEYAALDENMYARLHRTLGAAEATGLTEEGVARADRALIAYLRGDQNALSYTDSVYGETRRVFHEREITHMQDVYALFSRGRRVRAALLCAGLLLSACVVFLPGGARGRLFRALRGACCALIALTAIAGIYVAVDFERAFLLMHRLLFRNDLWLMNPETDLMIRLLPEAFFMGIARNIAVYALATVLALLAIGCLLGRKKKA